MFKKLIYPIILVAFFLLLVAADNYNQPTVTIQEGVSYVHYKFQTAAMADSTGSYHSPPLFIGDCNDVDGRVSVDMYNGTGTEDANIIYHFSQDLATWESTTPADLDNCTTTAKYDTIGINSGTDDLKFHVNKWMIIEVDGQTGNPSDTYLWINLHLKKDVIDVGPTGQPIYVGSKAKKSTTNP